MSALQEAKALLTADPGAVAQAETELKAAMPGAHVAAHFADGVLLADLPGSFWELAERWRAAPPIFVRHICPVQEAVPLAADADDVTLLRAAAHAAFGDLLDPSLPFSIQTRLLADVPYGPYDVNTTLAQALAEASGAPLDVRNPQQIVSVVIAFYKGAVTGFLGLSPAIYNLSDWAGGKRRFAREKEQISRAEFKLLEALELFAVPLPEHGVALDLGAAPGGWTRVLRQKGQYVTAVDPAALHPSLAGDAQVRHLQMTAEEYLEAEPDSFDLIVNDMRLDARDSARLLVAYAPHLYRHGAAVMTLKLPHEHQEPVLEHALSILAQAYEIAAARQLFHNRSEVTVYLKPKAGPSQTHA
jgi:23S rRNA (cytidine2498-2'-O)-methyltransferase